MGNPSAASIRRAAGKPNDLAARDPREVPVVHLQSFGRMMIGSLSRAQAMTSRTTSSPGAILKMYFSTM